MRALFLLSVSMLWAGLANANEVIGVSLDRQLDAKPVVMSAWVQMAPNPMARSCWCSLGGRAYRASKAKTAPRPICICKRMLN
jgi:hypothetical protein